MSLYGPRINLPKVEIPIPSTSWNLDKEKKIAIGIIAAIIILALAVILLPPILQGAGDFVQSATNPAIQISWKNNPLDLTNGPQNAELILTLTNTSTKEQDITFNFTRYPNELIIFCPNSIFDANKAVYLIENVAPKEKRVFTCVIQKNRVPVFTGDYTIELDTSLGKAKTTLQIITKQQ